MKMKIIYEDLSVQELDTKDFGSKAHDGILVIVIYDTNQKIILEQKEIYVVWDKGDELIYGGCSEFMFASTNKDKWYTMDMRGLIKSDVLPIHTGATVEDDIYQEALKLAEQN